MVLLQIRPDRHAGTVNWNAVWFSILYTGTNAGYRGMGATAESRLTAPYPPSTLGARLLRARMLAAVPTTGRKGAPLGRACLAGIAYAPSPGRSLALARR